MKHSFFKVANMSIQLSQNDNNKTTEHVASIAKQKHVFRNNQTCDNEYKQKNQQVLPDYSYSFNSALSHLSKSQLQLVETYLDQIIEVNKTINLTKISSIDKARILHLEDSLSGLPELLAAPDGLYADLGSGGGFPGVPLAITSGRTTYLIDSVQKKLNAVSQILYTLGLSEKIICKAIRIEDLALSMSKSFSALSARALSSLPSLLELAVPLLLIGGDLICYKAHVDDEELYHSKKLKQLLGMELYSDRSFYLSDNETFRRILVFKKVKEPEITLPRRVGLAQKRPF